MRDTVECYTEKGEKRCLKKELPFHWLVTFSTDFRETKENEKASKIYFFLLFSFNSIFFFEEHRYGAILYIFPDYRLYE